MKRILVTGSSGTIAASLIPALKEEGYEVIGLDRLPALHVAGTTDIVWDLNNPIPKRIGEFDIIIHLACNSRVYYSVINPDFPQENYITMFNVLEFARKQKEYSGRVPKIVFSSSRETYGNCPKIDGIIRNESDVFIENCESPYSSSKIANECLIHAYNKCYNMPYLIYRFSNVVFGHDYSKDTVIPTWIRNAKKNLPLKVYGKKKKLDFTFIDDTVKGIIGGIKKGIKNTTINLGGGKPIKLVDVAKIIVKLSKSKSDILLMPERVGEVTLYHADISKAMDLIGYEPTMDIKNEIKKAIESNNY